MSEEYTGNLPRQPAQCLHTAVCSEYGRMLIAVCCRPAMQTKRKDGTE